MSREPILPTVPEPWPVTTTLSAEAMAELINAIEERLYALDNRASQVYGELQNTRNLLANILERNAKPASAIDPLFL